MNKLNALFFAAVAIAVAGINPAQAQFRVGGHVGLDFESTELYVGPHLVFDLPVAVGEDYLQLNPEFSWYLSDTDIPDASSSFWLLNVTALYPLGFDFADAYFGAGVVFSHSSYSSGDSGSGTGGTSDSSSHLGIDLKGGAEFGQSTARPFGEVGLIISDSTWLFLQGGVRFGFGKSA